MSCPFVKIKDCVEKISNWNPITEASDQLISYIDLSAVDKDSKKVTNVISIEGKSAPSRARQLVKDNDVLVSTVRPNLNGVAKVYSSLDGATASTGFTVLRAKKDTLDSDYLFHWVKTSNFINDMVSKATGQSYPAVSDKTVLNSEIPLPPLEEQRRIASILDKADEIRQKRQQAIEKLDELLQASFIDMFGDESNDYKGIDKVNLLDKVDFLTGFAFKSNDFKSSGIKLCRGINVLTGYLDWNSTAYWDSSEHDKFKKFELKKDDIVIAMDRPWISSGFKISMIGEEDKDILLVQRVARLRSKESSYSNFIYHLLDSHNFKNHCNVTETTIPHISPTDFKTFLIPDASQSQILKFDKFAKAVRAQKQAMRISLEKSNDFFNSLQQKAFNGTL